MIWLTIIDPGRRMEFGRVLGTTTIAVERPYTVFATLPGQEEPVPVYMLDLAWVELIGRRDELVAFLAERFGYDDVGDRLEDEGVPILAAGTALRRRDGPS